MQRFVGKAVRNGALLVLVGVLGSVSAQISGFEVRLLDRSGIGQMQAQLGTIWSADPISQLLATTEKGVQLPGRNAADATFKIGDYVVLCFDPGQDLYIQILDTTPAGVTHQLYPEAGAVLVTGGRTYCVGDGSQDLYIYADEASGTGAGKVWVYGVAEESNVPTDGDWPRPMSSIGFGTAVVGSISAGDGKFEAWFNYSIVDASR